MQDELKEADELEKPILAFVERMQHSDESDERRRVVDWLRGRVKYQEFLGLEQLGREVVAADNVYYRTPDRYQELRRGSHLFFYVSEPEQAIRGSALITDIFVGDPESCFSRYGTKGLFDYNRLEQIAAAHDGKVLAIAFDWYREFNREVTLPRLRRAISNYNPQSAFLLDAGQAATILREGLGHVG